MPKNNLGVDPDEWFTNPLDSMPIAKDNPSWEDTAPSEYEPPRPEEEVADNVNTGDDGMHQKMYELATARYNPFSVGGSENCDSDLECNTLGGGSERIHHVHHHAPDTNNRIVSLLEEISDKLTQLLDN